MISLDLPWPPSVNMYWRRRGAQYFISSEGQAFRTQVCWTVRARGLIAPLTGDLQMSLVLLPPDNRRRDLDNVLKALFDALGKAGVYHDDSQVRRLYVEHVSLTGGVVKVNVAPLAPHETINGGYRHGKVRQKANHC